MDIKAKATHYAVQCTPRKARLLRGLVKGKPVAQAIALLSAERRAGSVAFVKLLKSALSQLAVQERSLAKVAEIVVNEGPKRRSFMPRAQGRATLVLKRMSHVSVFLKTN